MTADPPSDQPLPYQGLDPVAEFLRAIDSAPDWACLHLVTRPGTPGVRQMCAPERAACLACATAVFPWPCAGCHGCGISEADAGSLSVVTFGVTRNRIVCGAVLCALCLSLVPQGVGRVHAVPGAA